MPRTDIRVDVPTNPDDLTVLIGQILAQDAALNKAAPGSSPLNPKTVAALQGVLTAAKPDRDLIASLTPQIEAAEQRSVKVLGLSNDQGVRTDGTGLFLVTKIRDALLAEYKGEEKEMEGFGFDVFINTTPTPQRKSAAQAKKPAQA
jgi:hypothetical protein